MGSDLARQRYLQRHIEPDLPDCPPARSWHNVLVIPAYRESPELLERLTELPGGSGRTLVILILNRPDTDPDQTANQALRQAATGIRQLNSHSDLYVHDLDQLVGALPAKQGVGLARKTGCDLALKWRSQGVIGSPWICSSDADALLPADYFRRLEETASDAVAAVYPFWHTPGQDRACNRATALYELRLHHYVLGLDYAGSPYAFHSLGSCLAVKTEPYAQVRGFPKRAAGEDFYLLNKLAKLGPIARPQGKCIELQSRLSRRTPFGTGPAAAQISAAARPSELPLFYHPACFEALRALLTALPALHHSSAADLQTRLAASPAMRALEPALAQACNHIIRGMGLEQALAHCRRQGKSRHQFLRQFQQWFDGFRTLKFIHGIRDAGWPEQSFTALPRLRPELWPAVVQWQEQELRRTAMRRWGWVR